MSTRAHQKIPRAERFRLEGMADFGSGRVVLARSGTPGTAGYREAWWWRSGKSWAGITHGYEHGPARLCLAEPSANGRYVVNYTVAHEGGRLSKALLLRHAAAIDAHLRVPGAAARIDPRFTNVFARPREPARAG